MKKINIPLIIGLIIVMGIVFLIFFGEYYAPHDPSGGELSIWSTDDNGENVLKRAPFAPDKNYKLGTDNGGRDVLSVIMAGAKNTFTIVFLATLLRFLIAIPIAFFAAFGERISQRLIVIFSSIFSAIPSLLVCIIVLKINVLRDLDLVSSIIAFIMVFTIVGWGRLAGIIEEKIKEVLDLDFIKGEIAIGKSKFVIAVKNVTAHIMPSIVIYVFLEIALVLLLLAQLGVFEVFVGNKQIFAMKVLGSPERTNFNYFPEWGAMLASTRRSIVGNMFWMSLYPLLAFSVGIMGFNLLGQGLNHELNKRNSMFISYVNRFWFHLSPMTFIDEIKNFKKKRKNVILKSLTIIILAWIIMIPILNAFTVTDSSIMAHLTEIHKDEYGGRLIGTDEHDKFSDYIVSQLESYKIKPLFNEGYISEFLVDPSFNIIDDSDFLVKDMEDEVVFEVKYKVDYYFENWHSTSVDKLQGELLSTDKFLSDEYHKDKDYILVSSSNMMQNSVYDEIRLRANEHKNIKAIIIPDLKQRAYSTKKMELGQKGLTRILDNIDSFSGGIPPIRIHVGKRAGLRLDEFEGNKVEIRANIKNTEGLVGKNIGGIIEGKSKENPIIITTTYDYLGFHDRSPAIGVEDMAKYKGLYENGTSMAGSLEMARNLGSLRKMPERSIVFLFIDGTKVSSDGILNVDNQGVLDQGPLLVHLKFMGITRWNREEDSLYHNTIVNNLDLKVEQDFHRWLRRNSSKSEYYILGDKAIRDKDFAMLQNKEMLGIVLQGIKATEYRYHEGMEQSDIETIDMDRLTAHIQYLLDAITDMAYGKTMLK